MGLNKLGETSGARTTAIRGLIGLIKDIPMDEKQGYDVLGYIYEYLISNFVQFAEKNNYKKLAIAGGVSANLLLRRELEKICLNKNWQLFKPRLEFCGDNAAMVASQAFYEYQKNNFASLDLNAISSESL